MVGSVCIQQVRQDHSFTSEGSLEPLLSPCSGPKGDASGAGRCVCVQQVRQEVCVAALLPHRRRLVAGCGVEDGLTLVKAQLRQTAISTLKFS